MSEPNPYAPPKVDESEAPSAIYWQCYGERVLARNGAMLPKVDLETGASDDEMTSVARSYQAAGAGHVFKIAMFVGIYFFAQALFENDSEWLLWTLVGASIVMGWLGRLRGGQTGAITIWEFRETVRERRRQIRRKIRISLLAGSFLLMILGPSLLLSSGPFHAAWVLRLITTGLVLLLANALWAMFDRPSTRSESGPDGWLRIRKVHPAAMAKLRKIEAEQQQQAATAAPHRKRLVRTSYYHKYPLASLLGTRRINPLQILVIALMKLLRSKRLERETFHFSEAAEIPEANLSDSLQQKIQSWRARHPDWPLLQANRLPSPAGDLTVESATLVSPGLEHSIHFIHTWLEQKSSTSTCMFEFHTFIKPGGKIYTTHMQLIQLPRPHVDAARVKGSEEEVFRAHLTRCARHEIDAPADRAELLERIHREKLEIDDLLEAGGYHGPTREVG
jgi:hypothetical protein